MALQGKLPKKKVGTNIVSEGGHSLGMREKTPIIEIAYRSDIVVHVQDRISVVYRLMKRNKLQHIPVMDRDQIVGIISRKSIKRLGFGYTYDEREDVEVGMFDMLQADQVMDKNPPQVSPEDPVLEVAELMATQDFAALPIVHEGKPVGVIDINEIMLILLRRDT